MAYKNQVTNEIKNGGGGATRLKKIAKKRTASSGASSSSGMGYTKTATNRTTGQKTITKGKTTPVTSAVYRSGKPATPTKIGTHSGTATVRPLSAKKKIY